MWYFVYSLTARNLSLLALLLLDDDRKHAEQNVVGPSFAVADVYCPFKTGLREAR